MGYYSTVAITCNEIAKEKIVKTCEKVRNLPDKILTNNNVEDEYLLFWKSEKWDRGYSDIDAICSILDEMDNESSSAYKLIRIGTDVDDIEIRTNSTHLSFGLEILYRLPLDFVELEENYGKS